MSLTDKTVLDSNPELVSLALLLSLFSLIGTKKACKLHVHWGVPDLLPHC